MIKLYKNKGGIKLLLVVGALALIIIFLLIYRLKETKKNNTISEELEKEIIDFMSNIDSVDIRDVEKVSNKVSDDTVDLNELFKTMSLTIVKDKSDYDFDLLRNTKK